MLSALTFTGKAVMYSGIDPFTPSSEVEPRKPPVRILLGTGFPKGRFPHPIFIERKVLVNFSSEERYFSKDFTIRDALKLLLKDLDLESVTELTIEKETYWEEEGHIRLGSRFDNPLISIEYFRLKVDGFGYMEYCLLPNMAIVEPHPEPIDPKKIREFCYGRVGFLDPSTIPYVSDVIEIVEPDDADNPAKAPENPKNHMDD